MQICITAEVISCNLLLVAVSTRGARLGHTFWQTGTPGTIRMVSSTYLRLLVFLLAILIPACALSSLAFLMTHSAQKLNKQGDNIQA